MKIRKILAGKVLIIPKIVEDKTVSGIIIPDSSKEKPSEGVVVLVGIGKKDEPMEVVVDDNVTYGQYSGIEIKENDINYLLLNQSDILYIK